MSHNPIATNAVRTSNRAAYDHVSAQETLEYAVVRFNLGHPRLGMCNFATEITIDHPGSAEKKSVVAAAAVSSNGNVAAADRMLAEVKHFFSERGLTCARWIPAAEQNPDSLAQSLEPLGLQREESVALVLPRGVDGAVDPKLKFLGARAMRRAVTAILTERFSAEGDLAKDLFELEVGRLDDPQYDAFVAIKDERPVAMIAVHQVGDVGRIRDLYVIANARRVGFGTAAVQYAIATARRWAMRTVCAEIATNDGPALDLSAGAGFEQAGRLVQFRSPAL